MKTKTIKKKEIVNNWYLIDAKGVRLGKLAVAVAELLMGKNKLASDASLDSADNIVIVNSTAISVHAKKLDSKKYYSHSGYMGHLKVETLRELLERKPEEVIKKAVKGMLPKNKLQDKMLKHLFIYSGEEHKHEAQQPVKISVK